MNEPARPLRVLELFCGIGGVAAALSALPRGLAEVCLGLDVDTHALAVYQQNWGHRSRACNLEWVSAADLAGLGADLWWLSPPCQPYTHRGAQRDLDDPRAASLRHLVALLPAVTPHYLALENVPGFAGSRGHQLVAAALDGLGYQRLEGVFCPSELGLPNRRRRFYLVASREGGLTPRELPEAPSRLPLAQFLDAEPEPGLELPPAIVRQYQHALHRVSAADPTAMTACFTSAYGRSWVRSGSYLEGPAGQLRRFSPREVLRLLGFPPEFTLSGEVPRERAWALAGNSLAVPVVRQVLAQIPALRPPATA